MKIDFPRIRNGLTRLIRAEYGQAATEYTLMVALVAFGATAGYQALADGISHALNHVSSTIVSAFAAAPGNDGGNGN